MEEKHMTDRSKNHLSALAAELSPEDLDNVLGGVNHELQDAFSYVRSLGAANEIKRLARLNRNAAADYVRKLLESHGRHQWVRLAGYIVEMF